MNADHTRHDRQVSWAALRVILPAVFAAGMFAGVVTLAAAADLAWSGVPDVLAIGTAVVASMLSGWALGITMPASDGDQ